MAELRPVPAALSAGDPHDLVRAGRGLQARAVRGALASAFAALVGRRTDRPSEEGLPQGC